MSMLGALPNLALMGGYLASRPDTTVRSAVLPECNPVR